MKRSFAVLSVVIVQLVARLADAEPTAAELAAAQAAFDEGKRLVTAGEIAAGCLKLEESQQLAPGSGTLLNLADCYEQLGRTASAWSSFRATAAAARQKGNEDRAIEAEARATALEPRLVKLRVIVSAPVAGLTILRDDIPLEVPLWNVPVAVDPGEHRIIAQAPGHVGWADTVTVSATASVVDVQLPALSPLAPEPPRPIVPLPTPQPTPPAQGSGDAQRIFGFVLGAVGLIALGVGVGFGVDALNKKADSNDAGCSSDNICPPDGLALRDDAVTEAHVSTALFVAGLAHLASGAIVIVTAPSSPSGSGAVFLWGARF